MKRTTRRATVLLLTIVFAISGTVIVFYAQGWRLSFDDFSLRKVGALYVKSSPENAVINLDGNILQQRRSFLSGGLFIHNLFPGEHALQIQSPGYHSISATVSVHPSLITRLSNVVLVPTQDKTIVPKDVVDFWSRSDNDFSQRIIRHANGNLLKNSVVVPGNTVVGRSSNYFLTENLQSDTFYVSDEQENINLTRKLAEEGFIFRPSTSEIHTTTEDVIIASTASGTYLINVADYSVIKLDDAKARLTAYSFPWATWSTQNDHRTIYVANLFSPDEDIATFELEAPLQRMEISDDKLVTLEESGGLSLITLTDGTFRPLASTAVDLLLTPQKNKIAVLEQAGIEVFSLPNTQDALRFGFEKAKNIDRLSWHKDNEHLFLHYSDSVSFLSLADKHLEYVTLVAKTERGIYDPIENSFYFLSNNALKEKTFPE